MFAALIISLDVEKRCVVFFVVVFLVYGEVRLQSAVSVRELAARCGC